MKYSHNNEQDCIEKLIKELKITNTHYVDVGASDGIEMSNTLFLAQNGWSGLCIEYNPIQFNALKINYKIYDKIKISCEKATPYSIIDIMQKNNTPNTFAFLNLDIDGYDYFVLDKLLIEYRPSIICAEINEKIPPPIKFTVLYRDNYKWNDYPFFGQSIGQIQTLCSNKNYSIVYVEYNNVFMVNNEIKHKLHLPTTKEAWLEGYFNKPDRRKKFPYNNNFESIYSMSPENAIKFINAIYSKHNGEYLISI